MKRGFRVVGPDVLRVVVSSAAAVVVVVVVDVVVLVSVDVDVVVVVSGLIGAPISVVETETLVGKELEVTVGVITNGAWPDEGVWESVGTPTVVGVGGGGWLQSSANRSTVSVRPASTAAAPTPAATVTQCGRAALSSPATGADPSRAGRMLVLR